jgi:1,4-alpha-glucan branching enzyme
VLNSDSEYYFGSNVGNAGLLEAEDVRWQTQPYSVTMTLPPLSVVLLKPDRRISSAMVE